MSKFKLTQTAAEVQNILNNSLQKPTGLAKTKLVGVGVNGQENIEIGDNLTLANGKLSAATGSLPSTITFDEEGNRTVGKNLKVDGKLTLKSLVSASNPDGDITKELGGSGGTANKLYKHTISCWSSTYGYVYLTIYNTSIEQINSEAKIKTAVKSIGKVIATGFIKNGFIFNVYSADYLSNDDQVIAAGYRVDTSSGDTSTTSIALDYHFSSIKDDVKQVR